MEDQTFLVYFKVWNISMKDDSKDFLQIRHINFFLDAFPNELIVHKSKIDGYPNLVVQI